MGQMQAETQGDTGLKISAQRDASRALNRLHDAVKSQNSLQSRLGENLGLLIDGLVGPDAAAIAASVADCLAGEFRAHVRRSDETFRTALADDPGLRKALGQTVATFFNRQRGLERLAEPVRRAAHDLAEPAGSTAPFSLIRNGSELIEQFKRHHVWINENIAPAVELRRRLAYHEFSADKAAPQSAARMEFDRTVTLPPLFVSRPARLPDRALKALVRDLEAIYARAPAEPEFKPV